MIQPPRCCICQVPLHGARFAWLWLVLPVRPFCKACTAAVKLGPEAVEARIRTAGA